MTPTDKPTQVGGLLPLPEPVFAVKVLCSEYGPSTKEADDDYFTADQMHAYAQANVQALEARLVALEKDAARVEMTPHMQTGTIDEQAVERAITAAMRQARVEGFGLCSDKWDTSFPTRSMWLAALNAAFGVATE